MDIKEKGKRVGSCGLDWSDSGYGPVNTVINLRGPWNVG
jgi:hypothetical protein